MTRAEKNILKRALIYVQREELSLIDKLIPNEPFEPSDSFKAKMDEIINGTKKERRIGIRKRFIIILVSVLLAIACAMSISAVRDFLILVAEEGISIFWQPQQNTSNESVIDNSPKYIPQGYTVSSEIIEDIVIRKIWRDENSKIIFTQSFKSGDHHITNENVQVIELNCEGMNIYCILTEHGVYNVVWTDDIYMYSMQFEGEISVEEIEKIVLSTKY